MPTPPTIHELEVRIAELEAEASLSREVDEAIEGCLRDRLSIDLALRRLMPIAARATDATRVMLRTFDESLRLHDFVHSSVEDAELPFTFATLERALAGGTHARLEEGGSAAWIRRIDVAGEDFGLAAIVVKRETCHARQDTLFGIWLEEVDNHLAAVATARSKSIATRELHDALRHPNLEEGLDSAITVLERHLPLRSITVLYRRGEGALDEPIGARHRGSPRDEAITPAELLHADAETVRAALGTQRVHEVRLADGAHPVGRILVSTDRVELNTFDHELLDRFAEVLHQRLAAHTREWATLKTSFPASTVDRLLREPGYAETRLAPRERACTIMFADITGFTALSERVLVDPAKIGRFIDVWGEAVVQVVWDTGGVFDKMVGDCVIGIWGPPFFEDSLTEWAERALHAAWQIREVTRAFRSHPDFPELAESSLDVAIGLHHCPLYVGTFGPDRDYTGFSSGMNNTARLQGQARGGEILCMDALVQVVSPQMRFGPIQTAAVKNVVEPLRFRALDRIERATHLPKHP